MARQGSRSRSAAGILMALGERDQRIRPPFSAPRDEQRILVAVILAREQPSRGSWHQSVLCFFIRSTFVSSQRRRFISVLAHTQTDVFLAMFDTSLGSETHLPMPIGDQPVDGGNLGSTGVHTGNQRVSDDPQPNRLTIRAMTALIIRPMPWLESLAVACHTGSWRIGRYRCW